MVGTLRFAHPTNLTSLRLQPLRSTAPQRVAMIRAEEAEMADLADADIAGRDRDDLGLGRGEARAHHPDRRPCRTEMVGNADRAYRTLDLAEAGERGERGRVEHVARDVDPPHPLQDHALRQALADAGPARGVA